MMEYLSDTSIRFFLICNTLAEAMLWRLHRSDSGVVKNGTGRRVDNTTTPVV